jgi:hypothetical protein
MYRTELTYFIVLTVIILFSQFLPTWLLLSLDNIIVRIAIVMLLLYLISIGPTAGILGLVAVSMIYLERNRRKVVVAAKKLDSMDWTRSEFATVEEASKPQTTVPVNEFDKPDDFESDFLPHETCDSGNFEPVAPSINEKAVLSTVYPLPGGRTESASASDDLYEQLGFGHIQGVETVGDNN